MTDPAWGGLYPVLVTPFDAAGAVDEASLRRVVRFALDRGATGLTALGVMGEAAHLDEDERTRVLAAVLDEVAGAVPVVTGVSAPDPAVAAARAAAAQAGGAGAAMVLLPPELDRASAHVAAVADAAPGLAIVLQDYPAAGHPPAPVSLLAGVAADVPAVVAVKEEEPPTAARTVELVRLAPHVAVLGGLGGLWLNWELRAGSHGVMTGFAFPDLLARILAAAAAGDWDEVDRVHALALPALVWEFQPGVELHHRKAVLAARGVIASPRTRTPAPVPPAAAADAARLVARLAPELAG